MVIGAVVALLGLFRALQGAGAIHVRPSSAPRSASRHKLEHLAACGRDHVRGRDRHRRSRRAPNA
jgi:hypothetical protein